ncbi:hypothetical protein [Sulfitobacter dubius]|uniref:Uncharacterized protein n=1 Tax=Sulfitobacter dubius TaxID=218673 RepID=A0ABY3ZIN2_9RHOB|nr:hypothetical protein [Sulfitobacter dubius]UOA14522.1 hypothetical protein DSM109990_01328 [Sulfitobacter dubius]
MKKQETAQAEQEAMPKDNTVKGTLRPVKRGNTTAPNLFTKDDAPKKGSRIKFMVKGKTYSAIVAETFEAGGETAISFKGDITVQK